MALDYATYWLELSPQRPLLLPEGMGGLVRGTFGNALRAQNCLTGAPSCNGCRLARQCNYQMLFAPLPPETHELQKFSAVPPPFVLHVDNGPARRLGAGQRLRLGITLIGSARAHLTRVLTALRQALAQGWTRERVALELHRVEVEQTDGLMSVIDPRTGRLLPHPPSARLDAVQIGLDADAELDLHLHFLSPTALKQNRCEAGPRDLMAHTWLVALVRRIGLLADFYGESALALDGQGLMARAERCSVVSSHLQRRSWARYSARQKQTMPLSGLVGEVCLRGPIQPFLPLMRFATRLHVGRHASFGLGAYTFRTEAVKPAAPRRYSRVLALDPSRRAGAGA